ncbi:MAG: DUF1194 domain-containing protein [Silicimonas sp.]|nr:DUF1194 domain-containing protein [Silicimonas sp.]RZV99270.1 MAG: DUF1194 domain-containing protein [Paracoccaceae bacterium]
MIATLLSLPGTASACRLALALAVDVSVSVDQREYALQRNGLANALRSPDVIQAFLGSPAPVALAAYEWSGPSYAKVVLDWTLVTSAADMHHAADTIARYSRFQSGSTSIGYALDFGADLMARAPRCQHRTIDLSADGKNNDGLTPEAAFRNPMFRTITVNALAVGGSEVLDALTSYLSETVIRGAGAFVEVARNHDDFERAMKRKLIREVKSLALSGLHPR